MKQVKSHFNVGIGDNGALSLSVVIPLNKRTAKELISEIQGKLDYLDDNRKWLRNLKRRLIG